jgi:alkyl sulfatase BDS1-like metallo-beta-lactamase superfamily hydrolase
VLNEDARSLIQTNGNIVSTGTANKYGTMQTYNEKVVALGNVTGAITGNVAAGSVVTLTATGAITLNTTDITNAVSGSSITFIITQDGTGARALTSNLKYAGGSKTLSTTAGAIDAISVFYDGTNYLASLVKGYA